MNKLAILPRGLDEILDLYGDPRGENGEVSQAWFNRWTQLYKLPSQMRTWHGRRTNVFRAHIVVGSVIEDTLAECKRRLGDEWPEWDFWGGCWWYRPMRHYDVLSTHAWGIAFDINPIRAPQGGLPTDQHPVIAEVCKEAGFVWGGDWGKPWICDPHHVQACANY